MTKDQRSSPRVEFRVTVHAEVKSRLQEFYSRNLSEGGIYLEFQGEAPKQGSVLGLAFDIPGRRNLKIKGKVMYVHPFESFDTDTNQSIQKVGLGIRFIELSSDDKALLSEFVAGKHVSLRN